MPKPYATIDPLARTFIACALESGLSSSDAVKLGIAVVRELDLIVRTKDDILPERAIAEIHLYAASIIRSGSTFRPFDIAVRAVATWREARTALRDLHSTWRRQRTTGRTRERAVRREQAGEVREPVWPGARDIAAIDLDVDTVGSDNVDGVFVSDLGTIYDDFAELKRYASLQGDGADDNDWPA